jgi:hypothetical protein
LFPKGGSMKGQRQWSRRSFLLASLAALRSKQVGAQQLPTSQTTSGVEITEIKGWHAVRYFWRYKPEESTVHPLPALRNAGEYPSPRDVEEESKLLTQLGSGVDVLEYNPNPSSPDHNNWLRSILRPDVSGGRPFYIAWEHVYGTRYVPVNGSKDMSNPTNRRRFEEDLRFVRDNVILPCQSRYATLEGQPVIYLWSMGDMYGDFGSLLEELRSKYSVRFVGGTNLMYSEYWGSEYLKNLQGLDGFMEYSLFPSAATPEERAKRAINYSNMVARHKKGTEDLQAAILKFKENTGREYYLGSTMQFAFDDTRVVDPQPRGNFPMYPQTVKEVTDFAQRLRDWKSNGIYSFGPLVIWDEFFEGAAVAPSQCLPETLGRPDRFVGCGYVRPEIVLRYFGNK